MGIANKKYEFPLKILREIRKVIYSYPNFKMYDIYFSAGCIIKWMLSLIQNTKCTNGKQYQI